MTKILVVDDSPIDRTLVEGILKKDGRRKVLTACHGADALAKLPDFPADVVITDLQMPELDGLQLVTAMRFHYPRIPVVLVTAHGSEELAIRALEQGAANYVPKSKLADRLLDTVDQVLALARTDRSYELLTESMRKAEFEFEIGNDITLLDRLVELVQQIVVSIGLCDAGGQVRLGMALEEALRACVFRGNLEFGEAELQRIQMHREEGQAMIDERCKQEPFAGRLLRVHVLITSTEARFHIEHDGQPLRFHEITPTSSELEDTADRSIILMRAFMDEVHFSTDGKQIDLVKLKQEAVD